MNVIEYKIILGLVFSIQYNYIFMRCYDTAHLTSLSVHHNPVYYFASVKFQSIVCVVIQCSLYNKISGSEH